MHEMSGNNACVESRGAVFMQVVWLHSCMCPVVVFISRATWSCVRSKSAIVQTQCLEGLREICGYLQDDDLKDQILHVLGVKDSFKGSVALASITPMLTDAFHRHWLLAQAHQQALMVAVDLQETGFLNWESFSLAATLMAHTLPGEKASMERNMEQSKVFDTFQSACRLSGLPDACTLENARMKLAARFWRLWSLAAELPQQDAMPAQAAAKQARQLPCGYEGVIREKAEALQSPIAAAVQVRVADVLTAALTFCC